MRTVRVAAVLSLLSCGGPSQPPTTTTATPSSTVTSTGDGGAGQVKADKAHRLVVTATSCWLGGIWAQAEGQWTAAEKRTGDEARCKDALFQAGAKDEDLPVLRALDPKVTSVLSAKVEAFAKEDGFDADRTKNLKKLFDAIVDAQREALMARRAADRIKLDYAKLKSDKEREAASEQDSDKLTADEIKLAKDMKATAAMEALYKLDAGAYTKDAHALGLVTAMERVKAAWGLPGHLKLYTAAGPYHMVFGVEPPVKLGDEPKAVKPGTWLTFEVATAAAAGHPVPATVKAPKEVNQQAWAGVVAGFADKLKAAQGEIGESPFQKFIGSLTEAMTIRTGVASELAKPQGDKPKTDKP